jgi:hypothetical protein
MQKIAQCRLKVIRKAAGCAHAVATISANPLAAGIDFQVKLCKAVFGAAKAMRCFSPPGWL